MMDSWTCGYVTLPTDKGVKYMEVLILSEALKVNVTLTEFDLGSML